MNVESLVEGKGVNRLPTGSVESISKGPLLLLPEATNKHAKLRIGSTLRRPLAVSIMLMIDGLALLLGLALAGYLMSGESRALELMHFAPVLLAVWFSVFAAWDLYAGGQRRNVVRLIGAIFSGVGLFAIASIMYPEGGLSVDEILFGALAISLLAVVLHRLYRRASVFSYRHGWALIPTLIIGEDEERASVREAMQKSSSAYACVGELNTGVGEVDLPLVRDALDRTGAQSVILAAGTEHLPRDKFRDILHSLRLRNVRVKLVRGAGDLTGGKSKVLQEDMGITLLDISSPRLDTAQRALKRWLDVVGSLGGLLVLAPLLVTVAILIRLTSPGPALFRQKRVGSDEKVFTCYKFRSMYEDAERRQAELEAQNEAGDVIFKIKNDPRVTAVGRFIRSSSIDELPQLINVLKGEMSLVGPRPLPLRDFERMSEIQKRRLGIAPGITGFWQVSGRSDLSFEEMLRLDLYYLENWSLALDIKILFRTLKIVLRRDGAC